MNRTALIVDDEPALRRILAKRLDRLDWKVIEASNCAEARALLSRENPIDAVLLDLNLPDGLGWELLEEIQQRADRPSLVVMTGEGCVENAVDALRRGASDFLLKPFSIDALDDALNRSRVSGMRSARGPRRDRPIDLWRREHAPQALGENPKMLAMFEMVRRVAKTDASVLLTGESGTGKELVARAVHVGSRRRSNPLVVLNCAAIPETLIESELFGHAKGAFTGATTASPGLFVAANTGTLFLDEIGELPLNLQSKLLRVLQEREVVPLGDHRPVPIDTRIIAATNVDLERAVEDGRFREDLYYRLNVVPIEIAPLRERADDIPMLVEHFVQRANRRLGAQIETLDPSVTDCLSRYSWPGNVRELENTIERMVVLKGEGALDLSDVPESLRGPLEVESLIDGAPLRLPNDGLVLREAVEDFERGLIEQALDRAGGNKSHAARLVHCNRTTLIQKIKKLLPGREAEFVLEEEHFDERIQHCHLA